MKKSLTKYLTHVGLMLPTNELLRKSTHWVLPLGNISSLLTAISRYGLGSFI